MVYSTFLFVGRGILDASLRRPSSPVIAAAEPQSPAASFNRRLRLGGRNDGGETKQYSIINYKGNPPPCQQNKAIKKQEPCKNCTAPRLKKEVLLIHVVAKHNLVTDNRVNTAGLQVKDCGWVAVIGLHFFCPVSIFLNKVICGRVALYGDNLAV